MRITSGNLKGRTINVPNDELTVGDLFSGTRALGIEAISRGVEKVDLIEKNKKHAKIINKTIEQLNIKTKSTVYNEDVFRFLSRPVTGQYDLVFLDPPYKLFNEVKLDKFVHILKDHGVLIYLHSERNYPLKTIKTDSGATWQLQDTREYGATGVSFYTKQS